MAERSVHKHWPVMLLGAIVVLIFGTVLFTFQVDETEYAAVMTFGRPQTVPNTDDIKIYESGLHWKWPAPVDHVWRHDKRLQSYDLEEGEYEQMQTADDYQVVVQTYVLWRVSQENAGRFLRAVETAANAETEIDSLVRSARNTIIGRYRLDQLVNPDAENVKISQVEEDILERVQDEAEKEYGIAIKEVGFRHIGFPPAVSKAVFKRMRAERNRKSQELIAEGKRRSREIKAEADREAKGIIARAEAEATATRAEADEKAAEFYEVFEQNPELAAFLQKLDALQETLSEQTTLVLDTDTPPYDLFKPQATELMKEIPDMPVPEEEAEAEDGEITEGKSESAEESTGE